MGHKLDDDLIRSPTIDERLHAEAMDRAFVAWIERSNGDVLEYAKGREPKPEFKMFAIDIMKALNHWMPNGGAWIVQWSDPKPLAEGNVIMLGDAEYKRFVIIWIDVDGDPQFTIEYDDDFKEALQLGPDPWLERGASAWNQWRMMMHEVLDPSEEQQFKKAQGEKPPSLH